MKVLMTGDWHADALTMGVRRFGEIEKAVMHTVDCAIAEKAALYIFGGDLCDPDSGTSVFRCVALAMRAAMKLADAGIHSFWLTGNHDVIEDGSGESTLTPLSALQNTYVHFIHVANHPMVFFYEGVQIAALPFTATDRTYDPSAFLRDEFLSVFPTLKKIVISHLSVPGVQPGEETTEMPRGRDVQFPIELFPDTLKDTLLLQAHYHRRQVFTAPGALPIYIPGSLARLTFGEEQNEPGFWLLDF